MENRIIVLNFSPRSSGNCQSISQFIVEYFSKSNVRLFFVGMEPCSTCDYECLRRGADCPKCSDDQIKLMDAIVDASEVYYVVPNFCGYPCANYFAFNERSVGYFNGDRKKLQEYMAVKKRFVIVSNTENESFTKAMSQQIQGIPEILYMKTSKYKKVSIAGDILESEEARADLKEFLRKGTCKP